MSKRRIIFVLVVCFSTAAFAVQTLSQTSDSNRTLKSPDAGPLRVGAKTADNLTVHWSSVTYTKTLYNPEVLPEYRDSKPTESLSLSCEIEMADPRRLLGTAPKPGIEKITDSKGNDIEINQKQPQSRRGYFQDAFLIKWLGMDHGMERWKKHPERHPPSIKLDGTLRERFDGEIGLVRGHYEVLMAESIYHVDLPFKASDNWVRLTDDVDIRVIQARNVPGKHYYKIELRPENTPTALHNMFVGDDLPGRLIVSPVIITRNSSGVSGGSGGRANGVIEGSGIGRAEGIRFVMAANPAHVKIPFELRDIPLSAPAQSTPSRTRSSKQNALPPILRHLQKRTLTGGIYEADKMYNRLKQPSEAKDKKLFDVDWYSINYSMTLYNPAVSRMDNRQKLSVRCDARILEPKLVMGMCNEPIIERITDGSGRDTDISLAQPRPDRMYYKTPGYRKSRTLTPPSTLAQLEVKARLALKLPLKRRHLPKRKNELQPVSMIIRLDPALMGQGGKEFRRIKGYFHALTAESYKHIEVPFKANNRWVRLTSDVEIQVARAWHDGVKYRFDIKERSQAQIRQDRMHVNCSLPDGILVERQFTSPDDPQKSGNIPHGARSLRRSAGGRGSVGRSINGVDCRIDTIDYLIAVGPAHHKIPFELEHIPLPKP